ncbi:MAG: LysR family transcriptional regulator [Bacteriovoracaceae bacterium]|nr:LysR family transcriptional regulator [Bacteriovoracaceae bacterium]
MRPFKQNYEYFLLLCQYLNISSAAQEAGIQQAGLSKALRALEEEFKKPLFFRTHRGLQLTSYGETFRSLLIKTMIHWDSSLENEMSKFSEVLGTFTIGIHKSVAINILANFFPSLNNDFPDLKLKLELKKSSEVTKSIIDYQMDFGIVANPIQHPDLIISKLQKEFIACWENKKNDHQKILYYNPEMIEIAQMIKKYKGHKHIEISDYEVIGSMMQKANGVCLLPNTVAERYHLIQVGKALSQVEICLIYRYDSLKTKAFKEIARRIQSSFP